MSKEKAERFMESMSSYCRRKYFARSDEWGKSRWMFSQTYWFIYGVDLKVNHPRDSPLLLDKVQNAEL